MARKDARKLVRLVSASEILKSMSWLKRIPCGVFARLDSLPCAMIESFAHLEQIALDRDLADVFLESDEQEHAVPGDQILEALRRRRAVMRDCVERGKGGGTSMGKLVGNE